MKYFQTNLVVMKINEICNHFFEELTQVNSLVNRAKMKSDEAKNLRKQAVIRRKNLKIASLNKNLADARTDLAKAVKT